MSLHGLKACQVNTMVVGRYTVTFSISSSTGKTMIASRVVVVTPVCNTVAGDLRATLLCAPLPFVFIFMLHENIPSISCFATSMHGARLGN